MLALLQLVLAVAALWFAVWQISGYTRSLDLHLISEQWPLLVVVGVLYSGFYIALAVHWQFITRLLEPNVSKYQWLALFAAQPYKYLPSSFFTFTFRAKYAKQLGLGFKKSSVAQLIENFSMLASAAILAVCSWFILDENWLLAGAAFIGGIGTFILTFDVAVKIKIKIHISVRARLIMLGVSSVAWLIAGAAFFFAALILGDALQPINAIGSNAAAVGGGILAVFAPGGIGVREFIYGLFGVSAVVIIAWRLITAVVDLVVGPVAWLAIRFVQNK